MRFAFTDDQLLFRDTVRDLLAKECQPEQVRYAWVDDDGRLRDVWDALGEMGVLGVQVPETSGGLGLTELDLVLLLEETGRVALPDPIVETAAVAAPLLAEVAAQVLADAASQPAALTTGSAATGEWVAPWLTRLAGGGAIVAVALGDSPLVSHGIDADLLIGVHPDRPGRLVAVDGTKVDGVAQPSVDGARTLATVDWAATDEVVLAEGPAADALIARALDRGALGTAAQLLGLGNQLLDLTVAYVKERQQFGVPIGSFQAIKHHLADALLALEFARPVVYGAAWALADQSGAVPAGHASRAASHAKVAASDAARLVGRQALQCHGAIGYTVEYDLHLYLKRVWALSQAFGGADHHRRRVADSVLGP
jgi:alkylation response protein AidB-like acyl-CoA dehydrogenase